MVRLVVPPPNERLSYTLHSRITDHKVANMSTSGRTTAVYLLKHHRNTGVAVSNCLLSCHIRNSVLSVFLFVQKFHTNDTQYFGRSTFLVFLVIGCCIREVNSTSGKTSKLYNFHFWFISLNVNKP